METNSKAIRGIGLIMGAAMIWIFSGVLSSWLRPSFSVFAYFLFYIGMYSFFKSMKGRDKVAAGIMFWQAIVLGTVLYVFNYVPWEFFRSYGIEYSHLFGTYMIIFYLKALLWLSSIIILLFSKTINKTARIGVWLLLVAFVVDLMIRSILPNFVNLNELYGSEIVESGNNITYYISSSVEVIAWLYLLSNFSLSLQHRKKVTAMMLCMLGTTLGIFVVLGDGTVTELASLVGYIILIIGLSKLKKHSEGQIATTRLTIAAIIASVGMFFNLLPMLEVVGVIFELAAYIVAVSAYAKLNKSKGFLPNKTGFLQGLTAMILLLLATIIHALPSFGIGEKIAAILGLFVVLLAVLGWVKSTGALCETKKEASTLENTEGENLKPEVALS